MSLVSRWNIPCNGSEEFNELRKLIQLIFSRSIPDASIATGVSIADVPVSVRVTSVAPVLLNRSVVVCVPGAVGL